MRRCALATSSRSSASCAASSRAARATAAPVLPLRKKMKHLLRFHATGCVEDCT